MVQRDVRHTKSECGRRESVSGMGPKIKKVPKITKVPKMLFSFFVAASKSTVRVQEYSPSQRYVQR